MYENINIFHEPNKKWMYKTEKNIVKILWIQYI